jgi:hypothetical protein
MIIFVRTKLAFPNRERVSIFADFALYPHSAFRERIVGMSRTTATFSISLPPEMGVVLERVLKDEHRTRSELVREALRRYFDDRLSDADSGLPEMMQSDRRDACNRGSNLAAIRRALEDAGRVIHNADAGLLDRYVQSTTMLRFSF